MEVYTTKKGNLTAKTFYKTKKDANQRVMEIKKSLLPTSETYSGAILSDAKIPQMFDPSNNNEKKSTNEAVENGTKYSLRSDDGLSNPYKVIARETYERMVASGRYQFTEAMQDSMMGLKLLYKAILGKKMQVEDIPDFENAYIAENLMSSQNAAMQQEYYIKFMKPLVKAINALGGKDKAKRQAIIDYMMAKHGLERNQVMAKRDAKATADEAVIKKRRIYLY